MTTESVWQIPEPLSTCDVCLDDENVTVVRRHGNPNARVRLVLSHGSGLAIDLYYPFWSLLADDYDLFVFDFRNHGWNSVSSQRDHNIPTLIQDHDLILESIDHAYGRKPTVGVYHSLSTVVALLSSSRLYSALVLFEAPLCKPGASQLELHEAAERTAALTRKRGFQFKTLEDFTGLFRFLPAFARLVPGVLELMARTTLRESVNGEGYELRCPREYEAQIMDYSRIFFPVLDVELVSCPTKVISGDPMIRNVFLPSFDLGHLSTVDYDFIPDTTHLLQLEKPADCASVTREFLERQAFV